MSLFEGVLLVLGAALAVGAIDHLFFRAHDKAASWLDQERMPLELRLAQLVMSECPVSTTHPVPLHGTPDQVFKTWRGRLVPVDTKVRQHARVYPSDIAQLSVYRTILTHAQDCPVASYGYIRLVTRGTNGTSISYIKRRLLPDAAIVRMYRENSVNESQYSGLDTP